MKQKKEPTRPQQGNIAGEGKNRKAWGNISAFARPLLRAVMIVAAYLFAFIILDFISKQFELLPGIVAWYPPAGLTYTLLLVFGVRFAPAVTIALFISSIFIYHMPQPPYALLLWALIISLIYGLAAAFLRKRIRFDWTLRKFRDVIWLVVTAVLVSALLAILSVSSSALSSDIPRSEVLSSIFRWWIGETVGVLTVTPFLLVHVMPWVKRLAEGQPTRLPSYRSFARPTLSAIGQACSIILTLYWVFGARVAKEIQPLYLITLPLIWIALQRGFKGVSAAILALNTGVVIALWLFRFDLARLGDLELLMIVSCIVGLLMGAVVTERKQTEDKLGRSEERHRMLIEQASDGIFVTDNEGRYIEVNSAGCRLVGYSREEILQKTIRDLTKNVPDQPLRLDELRQGNTILNEREMIRKDGSMVQVEISAKQLPDGSLQGIVRDITERKQAINKMEEDRILLRTLIDNLPDRIFVMDSQGRKIISNTADWQASGGKSMEDVIGKTDFDTYPPELAEEYWALDKAVIESGISTFNREEPGLDSHGNPVWVLSSKVPILNDQGKVKGLVGIGHDITNRKRTEEELIKSEGKFRAIFDNASTGMFIVDLRAQKFFMCNSMCAKMLGYAKEEFLNLDIADIYLGEDIPFINEQIGKFSRGEEGIRSDIKFKRKNGSFFSSDLSPALLTIADKEYLLISFIDITERKRAEDILQKSEKRFRALVEHSMEEISLIDSEGTLTWESPTTRRPLGYPPNSFVGHTLFDLIHPDERATAMRLLEQIGKQPGSVQEALFRLKHQDGSWRWMEGILTNLLDEPAVQSVVINYRDITDRKMVEDALRESEEKYRGLVTEISDGIFTTDHTGKLIFANLALIRMMGYENPDQLMGRNFMEFVAPSQLNEFVGYFRRAMDTGLFRGTAIAEVVRADGTNIIIEVMSSAIKEGSKVVGTHNVARDITERKLDEERIQRQLEHLTALSSIDRVIASVFDLRISLSEILTQVTKELGVDAADIWIFNSKSLMLEHGADRGFRDQAIRKRQVHLGESYAGRAIAGRQLVHIPNLKDEPANLLLTNLIAGEDFVSYYGVPLIAKGQVLGVLETCHRTPLHPDAEWLDFLLTLAGQAAIAIDNVHMFENQQRTTDELELAYDATIEGWSHALDLRDKETGGHSQRVTEMTIKLAHILGLSETDLIQVRWGALLHDIGKMGVSDGILLKPGPLTEEEWVVMKRHPGLANEMLSPIRYLHAALDIPYCHHEWWDGTGYPRGLKGEQIPLAARIFAVVDVWDALISERPYRQAWSEEKARQHIQAEAGTHFDPQVVKTFFLEHG